MTINSCNKETNGRHINEKHQSNSKNPLLFLSLAIFILSKIELCRAVLKNTHSARLRYGTASKISLKNMFMFMFMCALF